MGKPTAKETPEKTETYVRIVEVTRPTDHWPAFQPQVITIQGTKVIKKEFMGKPDTKEMAFALGEEIVRETQEQSL